MERDRIADAYDRHGKPIYRFLCGLLGSREDAADVLQTVFTKLTSRGPGGIADLGSYLWTSARNEARRVGERRRGRYLEPRNGEPPLRGRARPWRPPSPRFPRSNAKSCSSTFSRD